MPVLSSGLIRRNQNLCNINWRLCGQSRAPSMLLDYMPPFNQHLSERLPYAQHSAGHRGKKSSPVVEAETNEDGPEEWRTCGPRKPNTSYCYDQQHPGEGVTPAGFRAPPSPTVKEARYSEGWRGQVGPGAGVQVEGAHLRRQGSERWGPQGRREGGPGIRLEEGAQGVGRWEARGAVEAGRACAP